MGAVLGGSHLRPCSGSGRSAPAALVGVPHSPLQARSGVALTIPGYRDIKVDVSVGGSFCLVDEKTGRVTPAKTQG